ncbi:TetR/AcrR family transcriptional regulator [Cobetia sp. UIB-001]|nr:TetR/AcrR family transcriptional regulator [Cobetia sp. LC6]MDL2191372.1 TetR/AcrR family transcriptional regulator [Cobetia sp. LC6]
MARTGRPRQFDREDAVRKAMELFWKNGFEGTSLAELRKELGNLSSASFYSAFESKQALYRECLEMYTRTCEQVFVELENEKVSARDAIKNMLIKYVTMQTSSSQPSGCMIVLSGLNCGDDNKDVEYMALSVRNDIRASLMACIARGQERGEWRYEKPLDQFVLMLDTFVNGIAIQARDGVPGDKLKEACELFMEIW